MAKNHRQRQFDWHDKGTTTLFPQTYLQELLKMGHKFIWWFISFIRGLMMLNFVCMKCWNLLLYPPPLFPLWVKIITANPYRKEVFIAGKTQHIRKHVRECGMAKNVHVHLWIAAGAVLPKNYKKKLWENKITFDTFSSSSLLRMFL